ncbi:mucin-like protein [Biomphalaria glabrata]|nr:mucin-like protein [Biomphalaria glabrata]
MVFLTCSARCSFDMIHPNFEPVTMTAKTSILSIIVIQLTLLNGYCFGQFIDCGGELSDQAGVITSPNFPSNYPDNAVCQWHITVATNQVISLTFTRLDLDRYADQNCVDYLVFYDGPNDQYPRIGNAYCGYNSEESTLNILVRSNSNKMTVIFSSDSMGSRIGFSASYRAIDCQPFTYGRETCNNECPCNKSNTDYCNSLTGQCMCNSNWIGWDCSVLVDHCQDPNTCSDLYGVCANVLGGYECRCKPGLTKDSTGQCQDPRECTQKQCSHFCGVTSTNPLQETCYCPKGMMLNSTDETQTQCVDCPQWYYGDNCGFPAQCRQSNTESYNKTNGLCHCYLNWTSTYCDQDFDECNFLKQPCELEKDHASCYNTLGSFECRCSPGYEPKNETTCDECGKIITKAEGTIDSGYHLQYISTTLYPECNWTIEAPEGQVVSISFTRFGYDVGYYWSSCSSSYVTIYDGNTTSSNVIHDTRWGLPSIIRTSGNKMLLVRYPAYCNDDGYGFISSGFNASYWTHECPKFMYGQNCSIPCSCHINNTVSCNSIYSFCYCKSGWTGSDCSLDIDECSQKYYPCSDYTVCINLPGTYQCQCKPGLVLDSNYQCSYAVDSSACTSRNCSNMCVSYTPENETSPIEECYCPLGMEMVGNQCENCKSWTFGSDCLLTTSCVRDHTATYDPRYGDCHCYSNWTWSLCEYDYDECYYGTHKCQPHSQCQNTYGSYQCYCLEYYGYIETSPGTCEHIDCNKVFTNETGEIRNYFYYSGFVIKNADCSWLISVRSDYVISLRFITFYLESTNGCQHQYFEIYDGESVASHRIGRYCGQGIPSVIRSTGNNMLIKFVSSSYSNYGNFYTTYTSHTCRSFTYGKESCDKNCRCVKENTQFCDNINGECICKPGWTSGDCSTDVNECLGTNNKVCPPNSDCVNTKGSFRCECHLGYKLNVDTGKCEVSSDCVVKQCSHTCYIISPGKEQCVCPDGLVLDEDTQLVCVVPYYPYGKEIGDSLLADDYISLGSIHVSKPIQFSTGAPFGDQFQTSAFVLSNGVIGFNDNMFMLGGATDISTVTDLNIMAAYMANMNPNLGQVYYHLYDKFGNQFGDVVEQFDNPKMAEVFARAQKDVTEYHGLADFKVNNVLITTWVDVQPFSISNNSTEVNTFQAVYISGWETINIAGYNIPIDEESAYVIFLYQYGKMKWDYVPRRIISIGTTGTNLNILKDLNTRLVSMLDRVPGNTGYTGVVSFEVGRVSGWDQSCNRYACDNAELLNDGMYQHEKNELYRCPCSLERLGNQWQLYETRGFFDEIYCYAISPVAKRRLLRNNRRNQLCCYRWIKPESDNWREWLRTWREATYLPTSPDSGHILVRDPWDYNYFAIENLYMHRLCCFGQEKYCNRFYKLFPDMGCSDFVTFVPRSALGDPHIATLDGFSYTMNGWGEYFLLWIFSQDFRLHCRTDRAEGLNGTLTNATIFTAFAVKESNVSSFQVELSASKTSMIILAGGIDVTTEFYKESQPGVIVFTDTLSVTREYSNNKTMVVAGFPSGVSIKVYVAVKSLFIEYNVPKEYENLTVGLLGNFNGNTDDEFTLPNGTVLSRNSSEREIYHNFAKAWAVNSTTSVFSYLPGESTETYQHPEFEPFYRDEADPTAVAKAKELCGETNDACIFDYLVTGDKEFATTTKVAKEEMDGVIISLANAPPTLKVKNESLDNNGFWPVINGTVSTLQVIVDDVDGDMVSIEILVNATGLSVNNTGFISYVPNTKQPISLRLRAVDSKGSYSPDLYIPLLVYPQCNSHGTCDTKIVREEYENGKFKVLSCSCYPAYTGKDCESEVDGCAIQPCFKGQTCTDLTAVEQGNSTIGYKCGPCPTGFQALMGTCVDVDECLNSKTCDHTCVNTEGSFTCSCRNGFRLDATDKKTCKDINECEERSSNCQHKCTNTEGNYTCTCYTGYTLDTDGSSCNIDDSIKEKCYDCQQVCITGENVTCGCRLGYEPIPNSINDCQDIDECKYGNQPCSQQCNNLDGSYECSCYTGYKLALDKVSCTACETPYYGNNCASTCQCNGRGTCNAIRGCVCNEHWSGENCEIDVDECLQPTACAEGLVCRNTVGAFKCVCPTGYKMNNTQCIDINECTDPTVNTTCDLNVQVCVNNIGSYSCDCKKGYARNNEGLCIDIDECSTGIDKCEQSCENKAGSFNCLCYQGYMLDDDRKSCIKVKDPCASANATCSYGCRINSNNEKECFCPRGYSLTGQDKCEDVNECLLNETNLCSNRNGCINTNGSFVCTCEVGFKLDNDNRSCVACNVGTWGQQCVNSCACGLGADHCDSKTGCVCKAGYTGSHCESDIDECKNKQLVCNSTEKCLNLPGTAVCQCQDGYERINGTCKDVNECSSILTNNCSQLCRNTEGGYECFCHAGYSYDSKTFSCNDIDECNLPTSKCEQLCINTEGSYRCSCTSDLILLADGVSCRASLPCVNKTDCSNDCALINGTDTCLCLRGTRLATDGKTCQECESNYYGPSCSLVCQCDAGVKCDNVNGSCFNPFVITTVVPTSTTDSSNASILTSDSASSAVDVSGKTTAAITSNTTVSTSVVTLPADKSTALPTTTVTSCISVTCDANKHEVCVDKASGYECVCQSGYMRANTDTDCTEISSYNFTATLAMDVSNINLDSDSEDGKRLKNEVKTKLTESCRKSKLDFISLEVFSIRKGSLIVDFVLYINKSSPSNSISSLTFVLNVIKSEGIILNGSKILMTSFTLIDSSNLCELRQQTNPCKSTEVCLVEDNRAVCKSKESDEDTKSLTLGLAIGLPLFAVLCIVVIILAYKYLAGKKARVSVSTESLQSKTLYRDGFQNSAAPSGTQYFEAWTHEKGN